MKQSLAEYLVENEEIFSIKDAQKYLFSVFGVEISRSHIYQIAKNQLRLSHKKIYYTSYNTNTKRCIIERQWAAQNFISMMKQNLDIINIDESSLQIINSSQKGWALRGQKRYSSNQQRINQVNIIAGVSSKGSVYFNLGFGKNNSLTVYYFILQLVQVLDKKDSQWRLKTVLMLDNAAYHRSQFLLRKLEDFNIPYCFLGPYQFEVAPIENLFAFIKKQKFNEIRKLPQKKQEYQW